MQRKWVLIAIGAAVVAALLVGGQTLLNRRTSGRGGGGNGTGPASTVATGSASQPATGNSTATNTAAPRQPAPAKLPPIQATGPAAAGAGLHPLSVSPPTVISGFSAGKLPSGTAYKLTFRPWGYGPGGKLGRNVVVTVVSATPVGQASGAVGLNGKTLLVVMDDTHGGNVYTGGLQGGTLTFVEVTGVSGASLYPTLSAVTTPAQ